MIKIGTALFEACEELERERGISKEVLIASLCDAMVAAYKKHMHVKEAANIEACIGCAFCATMCPDCIIKVERQ